MGKVKGKKKKRKEIEMEREERRMDKGLQNFGSLYLIEERPWLKCERKNKRVAEVKEKEGEMKYRGR